MNNILPSETSMYLMSKLTFKKKHKRYSFHHTNPCVYDPNSSIVVILLVRFLLRVYIFIGNKVDKHHHKAHYSTTFRI